MDQSWCLQLDWNPHVITRNRKLWKVLKNTDYKGMLHRVCLPGFVSLEFLRYHFVLMQLPRYTQFHLSPWYCRCEQYFARTDLAFRRRFLQSLLFQYFAAFSTPVNQIAHGDWEPRRLLDPRDAFEGCPVGDQSPTTNYLKVSADRWAMRI